MNTDLIKNLREKTGAGIMACKSALESSNGDLEKAEKILQEQGIASARKKIGRNAQEGIISSYIHANNKIGVLLEINCETDFVANTDDFKDLAHNITMQIAAMNPIYIDMESNPTTLNDEQPSKDNSLLSQQFIKDNEKSIQDLIEETSGKLGEKIEIKRFQRFAISE
tara:strand:+ start:2106 stop:2609 length:504 start_codon:yes stop_codon:yes gene_type:complete